VSDLSDEDEAELMAELAAVEREMGLLSADPQPEEMAESYAAAEAEEALAEEDAFEAFEDETLADDEALATTKHWPTTKLADDVEADVLAGEDDFDAMDDAAIAEDDDLDLIEDEAQAEDDALLAFDAADETDETDVDAFAADAVADAAADPSAAGAIAAAALAAGALAARATEAEAEDDAAEPASDLDALAAPRRVRRVQMLHGVDEDEAAVSRIMSKADEHLSEPDANRRRQAITQLKAAVAAKEAARRLGETDEDDGEVENAFRKDLRDVVRPSRPQALKARTERPRAAPLKLVAAQRIDLPEGGIGAPKAPAAPVRPRRVAVEPMPPTPAATVAAAKAGSFAEFAEEMGAHSLSDLLEAAAAYTAFVEGSEDFSRPQLINKVRETSDGFSREDGLRSFGTLLREGRIMKVRNGRFQISDETRFHPERRAG
jgi:hypothetical protein